MSTQIDRKLLGRLRVLGMVEGTSTLLLFGVAMPLKYFADIPLAVTVVGSIHGMLFLALVSAFIAGIAHIPIPRALAAAGVAAAVIPFGPFLIDGRLKRLGQ